MRAARWHMRASDLAASGTGIAHCGARRIPVPADPGEDPAALAFWLSMMSGTSAASLMRYAVISFDLVRAESMTFAVASQLFSLLFFILGRRRQRAWLTHMVGVVRASPSDIIHAKIAAGRGNFTRVNSGHERP